MKVKSASVSHNALVTTHGEMLFHSMSTQASLYPEIKLSIYEARNTVPKQIEDICPLPMPMVKLL